MLNRPFTTRQAGVGLIEVLISLLILAGGFLALTRFQIQLTRNQAIAMQRAEATLIADQTMNYLAHLPTSDPKLTTVWHNTTGSELPWITGKNATYEVLWWVTTRTITSSTATANCVSACDLKQISVWINWTDATGVKNNTTITRLISLR